MNSKIVIFTDGGYSRKNNIGGWAFIAQYQVWNNEHKMFELKKEASGSGTVENTTSNRMELLASIEALKFIKKPYEIEIISDSTYVVDTINKWISSFVKNDETRKNHDLMILLNTAIKFHKKVKAIWVRGHDKCIEHNRCDVLAQQAAGTYKGKVYELEV